MSLLRRSSCFPGAVVQETVEISQLLRGGVGLMGVFFGPVHRYRAGGRVHRDTAPIIRCISARGRTDSLVLHTGPHHNHHNHNHNHNHTNQASDSRETARKARFPLLEPTPA